MGVTREEGGWEKGKMSKIRYMVTDGNQIFWGEHAIEYTDIEV